MYRFASTVDHMNANTIMAKGIAHRADAVATDRRAWAAATVFARLGLAAGFLSAVADRFGLWGARGTGNVAWGEYDNFVAYTHDLAPYASGAFFDVLAATATAAETILGLALLFGLAVRYCAWASAGLLLTFGLSMFIFAGPQAPLMFSVFAAAGAGLLLALAPVGSYAMSVDRALGLDRLMIGVSGAPLVAPVGDQEG